MPSEIGVKIEEESLKRGKGILMKAFSGFEYLIIIFIVGMWMFYQILLVAFIGLKMINMEDESQLCKYIHKNSIEIQIGFFTSLCKSSPYGLPKKTELP